MLQNKKDIFEKCSFFFPVQYIDVKQIIMQTKLESNSFILQLFTNDAVKGSPDLNF